jgi:hypothetical protein
VPVTVMNYQCVAQPPLSNPTVNAPVMGGSSPSPDKDCSLPDASGDVLAPVACANT